MRYSRYFITVSVIIILSGFVVFFVKDGFRYGIDFQGGSQIQVDIGVPSDISELQKIVGENVEITAIGNEKKEFILKSVVEKDINEKIIKSVFDEKVFNPLKSKYPQMKVIGNIRYELSGIKFRVDLGEKIVIQKLEKKYGASITQPIKNKNEYIFNVNLSQLLARKNIIDPLSSRYFNKEVNYRIDLGEDTNITEATKSVANIKGIKVDAESPREYNFLIDVGGKKGSVNVKSAVDQKKSYIEIQVFTEIKKKFTKASIKSHTVEDGFIISETTYDPTQGAAIKKQAWYVTALVLIIILIYVALRFQLKYAVGAILALIHDAFAVLAFVLFFDREMDIPTLVSILTLMGYSLNDTIIIFDRIRENRELTNTEDIRPLVNKSISQSFSRTIITSTLTLFAVGCILFLGGQALENLSFALFIGIIVGTYSSIYIASPLVIVWEHLVERRLEKNAGEKRPSARKKKDDTKDKVVV